jgi:hypothetical protein
MAAPPSAAKAPSSSPFVLDVSSIGTVVADSPDGSRGLVIRDARSGAELRRLEPKEGSARRAKFSPDGRIVAVAWAPRFREPYFSLCDVASGACPDVPLRDMGLRSAVIDVAFHPGGRLLGLLMADDSVALLRRADQALVAVLRVDHAMKAIFVTTPAGHVDFTASRGSPRACSPARIGDATQARREGRRVLAGGRRAGMTAPEPPLRLDEHRAGGMMASSRRRSGFRLRFGALDVDRLTGQTRAP